MFLSIGEDHGNWLNNIGSSRARIIHVETSEINNAGLVSFRSFVQSIVVATKIRESKHTQESKRKECCKIPANKQEQPEIQQTSDE